MPRKVKPAHYRGGYQTQAKRITRAADADPSTRCWTCGLTLAEIHTTTPKAKWTAGHVNDGEVNGPLRAQCSPCNFSGGARITNQRNEPQRTALTW